MINEDYLKGRQDGYLMGYKEGRKYEKQELGQTMDDQVVAVTMGKRTSFSLNDVVDIIGEMKTKLKLEV